MGAGSVVNRNRRGQYAFSGLYHCDTGIVEDDEDDDDDDDDDDDEEEEEEELEGAEEVVAE